jgi:kumamolisin
MMEKFPLPGSERKTLDGATRIGAADPSENFQVSVILRPQHGEALRERVARLGAGSSADAPLTREVFAETHGAAEADIHAVKTFASEHKLHVVSSDSARRTVILSGSVAAFEAAFSVKLDHYEHAAQRFRGREGAVMLPSALRHIVQAVLGLDNRPQARAQFRRRHPIKPAKTPEAASFTPLQIAELYQFPAGTGAGQSIGFIELGGGTTAADLTTYFTSLGLTAPKLVSVSVDGGNNQPTGSAEGPDGEVMLDVEVAGSIAPEATLVVYFTTNTDAGFLDAITTAIHDTTHKPSVISISWGGPESSWTQQSFTAFDQAFQDAAALGITVCVASGDNGSSDGGTGNNVDFPASSPHVLACGGTSLRAKGSSIESETVWNDGAQGGAGGGGISTAFTTVPSWQTGFSAALATGGSTALSGRGVPDVAGDADPQTGYNVRVDGSDTVYGGTSAVAPLWAGLITRLNATRTTPIGFINPTLYGTPGALHDIVSGNNGTYAAAKGWDACTGLGSPNGAAIATLFAEGAEQVSSIADLGNRA